MATIVLFTVAAGGNVPPMTRIALELSARGHRVVVAGQSRQEREMTARGLTFRPLTSADFWESFRPRSPVDTLRQALRLLSSEAIASEAAAIAGELRADAVVVDCLLASVAARIQREGHPDAVLFHTLLDYWIGSFARGPVGRIAELRGTAVERIWNGASARIVTTDPALEIAVHGGADWVGGLEPGVPAAPDTAAPPLVVVSLSTTWLRGQTAVYQRILDALAPLPVRAVVTLGGLAPDRPLRPGRNTEILARADHRALFPSASLLVGHGGHSTTLQALAHGIPLLILPMHPYLDQRAVARGITRLGAGLALPKRARPARIRAAMQRLLTDPAHTLSAQRFGTHLRDGDGAGAAADAVESIVPRSARHG